MSHSSQISKTFGGLQVLNVVDNSNSRLINIATPIAPSDAATKAYVDSSVIQSNLVTGIGLTNDNNVINVNSNQTQITKLGNITIGGWQANTIQIPYGGTGRTSFSANKLIYFDGSTSLRSVNDLVYDGSIFGSAVPVSISNSSEVNGTNGSSLSVAGGVYFAKDLVVNRNVNLPGNVTIGNAYFNGQLSLQNVGSTNAVFTSLTAGNLTVSGISATGLVSASSISAGSLSTNTSGTSLGNLAVGTVVVSGTISCGNAVVTGSTTLGLGGLSVLGTSQLTNLSVSGFSSMGNIECSSLTTGSLVINGSVTTTNAVTSAMTIGSLKASSITTLGLSATTVSVGGLSSGSLLANFASIGNLVGTNVNYNSGSFSNLMVVGNVSTGSLVATSSSIGNLVSTNLLLGNISSSNLISSVSSTGSLYTTNQNSLYSTIGSLTVGGLSSGSLRVTGVSNLTSVLLDSATVGNLLTNGKLDTTFLNSVSITSGSILSGNATITALSASSGSFLNFSSGSAILTNGSFASTRTTLATISNLNTVSAVITGLTCLNSNLANSTIGGLFSNTGVFNNQTVSNLLVANLNSLSSSTGTADVNNLRIATGSFANCFLTACSIGTAYTSTSRISKSLQISANYQGTNNETSGAFLTVLPSTFIDNTASTGSVLNGFFSTYYSRPTFSTQNSGVGLSKATNVYIAGNVLAGANSSIQYNSGLSIGYVANSIGSTLAGQIMFERNDGIPYASVYTESSSNRLNIVNTSFLGGGGVGILSVNPITLGYVPSSTNVTPQDFASFSRVTSSLFSTQDSVGLTTGSLVINGGLGVNKNTSLNTFSTPNYTIRTLVEGGSSSISSEVSGLVLNGSGISVTNYTVNLTTSGVRDGQRVFITTNGSITNCSITNSSISGTISLSSATAIRMIFIQTSGLWFSC